MKCPLHVVALLVLSACQFTPLPREESPFYTLPAGSQLTLHEDLTIPAGRASVYIQGDPAPAIQGVYSFEPYCMFEMYHVKDTPQHVRADTFTIRKVQREDYSAAAYGVQRARFLFSDGGPNYLVYATVMRLESKAQPEVYRLTCQHWEVPPQMPHHLTISQIRAALGKLFTLKLPDAQ